MYDRIRYPIFLITMPKSKVIQMMIYLPLEETMILDNVTILIKSVFHKNKTTITIIFS